MVAASGLASDFDEVEVFRRNIIGSKSVLVMLYQFPYEGGVMAKNYIKYMAASGLEPPT